MAIRQEKEEEGARECVCYIFVVNAVSERQVPYATRRICNRVINAVIACRVSRIHAALKDNEEKKKKEKRRR